MTSLIQIWTCAAHHTAFRCGGWASVRVVGGEASGFAGGERNTTAQRMALAGLAAALGDLPPSKALASANPIRIHTNSPELASLADVFADLQAPIHGAEVAAPEDDLDLWARILTASKGRQLSLVRASLQPDTPIAFAAAWADLAKDRAKASGPFAAAIPKPNLAKVSGLA